jgi:2-amino-4-hydroxy-6-hydroxymethyldihydropteridine diphosphokinase
VALGSNLGDRLENLRTGLRSLQRAGLAVCAWSSVYETPPIGFSDQPDFLNLVFLGESPLPPRELLSIFQAAEVEAGRVRDIPNGPRTLDVDLILFRDRIIRMDDLHVPHPRWKERRFVALPLAEVGAELRDPETGWTVGEISRSWPMEPREIRVFATPEEIQAVIEEWQR